MSRTEAGLDWGVDPFLANSFAFVCVAQRFALVREEMGRRRRAGVSERDRPPPPPRQRQRKGGRDGGGGGKQFTVSFVGSHKSVRMQALETDSRR